MDNHSVDLFNSNPDSQFISQLNKATLNLLWFSEAEYPFHIIYWKNLRHFDELTLLHQSGYSSETKVAIQEFDSFFDSVTRKEAWHNEEEQAEVERYQTLVDLLATNLTDTKVYLLGEVEIDVYILGKTEHKAIAGLTTKIVST